LRDTPSVPPDAILLNLRMPLIDGLGFLRRLRQRRGVRDIPVAIIPATLFMKGDLEAELRALGADVRTAVAGRSRRTRLPSREGDALSDRSAN
jgi:CheY-like chemotaxis protein